MSDFNMSGVLKKYLDAVAYALDEGDADPLVREGVLRDIASQIAEMRDEEGLSDWEILSRLDPPEAYRESSGAAKGLPSPALSQSEKSGDKNGADGATKRVKRSKKSLGFDGLTVVASVFAIALGIWGVGGVVPSKLHALFLLPVPFAIGFSSSALKKGKNFPVSYPRALAFFNGLTVAVSLLYSIAFLQGMGGVAGYPVLYAVLISLVSPLIPFGLLLLPIVFSPYLVLTAGCSHGLYLIRNSAVVSGGIKIARWWVCGAAVALIVLLGWEWYVHAVRAGIALAIAGNGADAREAIGRIKFLGVEGAVLNGCYGRLEEFMGMFSPNNEVSDRHSSEEYRALYYKMTGRDYRDADRDVFGETENWNERSVVESETGGETVGASVRNLELKSAALDISAASSPDGMDAGPALAYAELTMEFLNGGTASREARCQIIMPPGGVASRLTLWIDGTEREAAFGERAGVRKAYQETAVVRRRDPALLTTAGPDRVLLQCFPVLPNVPMKVKVGFTLPLPPEDGQSALALPYIAERNFAYAEGLGVALWAESNAPMSASVPGLTTETVRVPKFGADGLADGAREIHAVRGKLAPASLASAALHMTPPRPGVAYRGSLAGVTGYSSLVSAAPRDGRLIAVAIDTSASMGRFFSQNSDWDGFDWRDIFEKLPSGARVALFAGEISTPPMSKAEAIEKLPGILRGVKFYGADTQTESLERAWDLCSAEEDAAVLWIHGKLPVDISDVTGLAQRAARRPAHDAAIPGVAGSARIFSFQVEPGANRLEEKMPWIIRVASPRGEKLEEKLSNLLAMSAYPRLSPSEQIFSQAVPDAAVVDSSPHVARLAFMGDIARAGVWDMSAMTEDARDTANAMRLVTAGTGAVVLENAEQYARHGLDPSANSRSVPTIPEPEEYALMAVTCALLAVTYVRRRRQRRA